MSKYVIELRPDCKVVQQICESDGQLYIGSKSLNYFEELNADYINEHFGDLQDTAYQRGLNDAWECGKKLAWTAKYGGYGERLNDVFGRDDTFDFYDYTPNEAIKKLKAFEQKQDKIEVMDEVVWTEDENVVIVVTSVYTADNLEWCDGVCKDGKVYSILTKNARKTGRHFDIASILEAMKA